MFVSIIINTEYMDVSSRITWYLRNLLHCKENAWILITHEYIQTHFQEIQEGTADYFFDGTEMRHFSLEEVNEVEQYFIPDKIFENKEEECGSRTEMLFDIMQNRYLELEHHIEKIFSKISKNHPSEKIEGVFHCLDSFESIRYLCREHNIPLIPYIFSAIRKMHGYVQTLYIANMEGKLCCSDECERRYYAFLKENQDINLFDNREIIALLGKERTLPLISLLDKEPPYEICICGEGFLIYSYVFLHDKYTDDDIHYECNKLYSWDTIRVRQHPMQLDSIRVKRDEIRSDPAAFILSCKRVATVYSQIMLKVLLWNRTAIMKKNTQPFSFMCEKDYLSKSKMSLKFLNYYIFCYLIPSELMFNEGYWRWRLMKPTETEIYQKHLSYYLNNFGTNNNILQEENKDKRFKRLLLARKCDEDLISALLSDASFDVDFDVATSKLSAEYTDGSPKVMWRLNKLENDAIVSRFKMNLDNVKRILFYPMDDMAGFVEIRRINIRSNGKIIKSIENVDKMRYYPKNTGKFELVLFDLSGDDEIEIFWKYKKVIDGLIE